MTLSRKGPPRSTQECLHAADAGAMPASAFEGIDRVKKQKHRPIGDPLTGSDLACPSCSRPIGDAVAPDDPLLPKPAPGQVVLCSYCGTLLEFTETLGLTLPADDTMMRAAGTPELGDYLEVFRDKHGKTLH